jgi:FlaA1/EpsC-like NDP-sugar epimerase
MTAAAGTVLGAGIIAILYRFEGTFSRGAMIIFGIIFFVMQIGSRLVFRFIDHLIIARKIQDADLRTKVLVYGAGRAGKLILDEVLFNEELSKYTVVGFIDDDTRKIGHKLSGVLIKTAEYWLDKTERTSNNTLEIWISSRFINDDKINDVLNKYSGKILVKRLKLRIE